MSLTLVLVLELGWNKRKIESLKFYLNNKELQALGA